MLPGAAGGLCLRDPISQTEEGADFPAFIPALLHLGDALIRGAERVFVVSNGVDHHVGCFHQDVFPFWFVLFEPYLSLNNANAGKGGILRRGHRFICAVFCRQVAHFGRDAA
jgi:hypothetical protein